MIIYLPDRDGKKVRKVRIDHRLALHGEAPEGGDQLEPTQLVRIKLVRARSLVIQLLELEKLRFHAGGRGPRASLL